MAALLFTARSLDYTAEATDATREQVRLLERGQVTERFSRAIDQLGQAGDDKLSIRLGGIYALERLMRDSPPDEPTVIEVLCAFVRTASPRPDRMPLTVPPSPPDVRAAVTVLARRPAPDVENARLDLSRTLLGLDGVHIPGADLTGADLTGADLRGAYLTDANLTDANLDGADLRGAYLTGADLTDAYLGGANLGGVYLRGADLTDANLTGAELHGSNLHSANLTGAVLSDANLRSADLRHADLTDADLTGMETDNYTRLPEGITVPSPEPAR
ncbi:pentapeptide repeat-containing protein [Plantactinospora sp. WMMC1484]|uniref:pentapeptide repeat-containing protein n=1 Tax=Plantactinospora sp. WMMC1484 TaxID=3404122 RepID=UPI003BF4ABCF